MTSLERRCHERGINFSATNSRMRCMPHTIHLAAIQVNLYQFKRIEYWLINTSSYSKALGLFQNQKARKLQRRSVITKKLFWHPSRVNLMKMLSPRRTLRTTKMQLLVKIQQSRSILFSLQSKRYEIAWECFLLNPIYYAPSFERSSKWSGPVPNVVKTGSGRFNLCKTTTSLMNAMPCHSCSSLMWGRDGPQLTRCSVSFI